MTFCLSLAMCPSKISHSFWLRINPYLGNMSISHSLYFNSLLFYVFYVNHIVSSTLLVPYEGMSMPRVFLGAGMLLVIVILNVC